MHQRMIEGQEVPGMSVRELKERIDRGDTPFLLDVRRPEEYDVANLNGKLIPLHELPNRLDEIAEHRLDEIVVYCRSGARSTQAVAFLRAQGFEGARNLTGGVLAWSREIDPSMPRY